MQTYYWVFLWYKGIGQLLLEELFSLITVSFILPLLSAMWIGRLMQFSVCIPITGHGEEFWLAPVMCTIVWQTKDLVWMKREKSSMPTHFHKAAIKCIQSNKTQAERVLLCHCNGHFILWLPQAAWWTHIHTLSTKGIEQDIFDSEGNGERTNQSYISYWLPFCHIHMLRKLDRGCMSGILKSWVGWSIAGFFFQWVQSVNISCQFKYDF